VNLFIHVVPDFCDLYKKDSVHNTVCQQISQLQMYGSINMFSVGGIIENVCVVMMTGHLLAYYILFDVFMIDV